MNRLSLFAAALLLPACAGGTSSLPSAASHGRAVATVIAPGGSNPACLNGAQTSSGTFAFASGTVPAGDALWVNVAGQITGISAPTNIVFHDVYYSMTMSDGSTFSKRIPDSQIAIRGSGAAGVFWSSNAWTVNLPTPHPWNAFLGGAVILRDVPYTPVSASISGTMCSDVPGVTIAWSFGEALYDQDFYAPSFAAPKLEDKTVGPAGPAGTPTGMLWAFLGGAGTGGSGATGTLSPPVTVTL